MHTDISNDKTQSFNTGKVNPDHLAADSPERTVGDARKIGLDCVGLSDHGASISNPDWDSLERICREQTRDSFVVLRGFEWTKGSLLQSAHQPVAHVNVFGTSDYTDAGYLKSGESYDETWELSDLYDWVLKRAASNSHLVCQFNHPTYGNSHFDSFALPPDKRAVARYFALLEIGSGPIGAYKRPSETERYYRQALRRGWRVAPTIGIDNFSGLMKQGSRKRHTAVLVDPSFDGRSGTSQDDILAALEARRTFASEDENFALEYWAKSSNGKAFMGGMLPVETGETITVHLWARSQSPNYVVGTSDAVGRVSLVRVKPHSSDDREELLADVSKDFSYAVSKAINVESDDICYYIKIVQHDAGADWIVSAPIWPVTPRPKAIGASPTSTVFVVDCSGSMSNNTPEGVQKLQAAKLSAEHCLSVIRFDKEQLGANHLVGLVGFSDTICAIQDPTPDLGQVEAALNDLRPMSSTNFGEPLDRAIGWLEAARGGVHTGRNNIIFLSDGMTNTGPVSRDEFLVDRAADFANPLRIYQRVCDAGISIHTIGFGNPSRWTTDDGCDEEVLRKLAQLPGTGGRYLYAADAGKLDEFYLRSFHDATGDVVFESTGTVAQGERKAAGTIDIVPEQGPTHSIASRALMKTMSFFVTPAYAEEVDRGQVLVTLGWSLGRLSLELRDPSGKLVDASYPGTHLKTDAQPICVAIDAPKAGKWNATVIGDEVPGGESRYHLIASARVPPRPVFGGGGGAAGAGSEDQLLTAVLLAICAVLALSIAVLIRRRREAVGAATPVVRNSEPGRRIRRGGIPR